MIRVALTQGGADAEAALPSQEVGAVHIEVLIEVCIFSRPGNRKDFAVQKIDDVKVSRAILTERYDELFWARVITVVITVVAASVALYHGALVALLGAFGWSTFAAAIVPTVAIGFN